MLTVLLAPPEGADDVLDVLGDLSGAELLDPFLWMRSPGDVEDAAGHQGAWLVARGRREPTLLQDVVVGRRPALQRERYQIFGVSFCILYG